MPYYTHYMNMDVHPCVCHSNICIQHCVHEAVHSEYADKMKKVKD
jgi:hypothetical protein